MLSKTFRVALLLPAAYWIYLISSDTLGVDPAKTLNHRAGAISLYYLILNLGIGALLGFSFRFPLFLRFLLVNRRFLGVVTFVYLIFHLLFYLTMESFEAKGFLQIVTKTYLIFGFSAWLVLLVLALTSNSFSVRKLGGKRWKRLHRFVYLAAGLVSVHVLLIEKADLVKYGILLGLLWLVQAARGARWLFKAAPRGPG